MCCTYIEDISVLLIIVFLGFAFFLLVHKIRKMNLLIINTLACSASSEKQALGLNTHICYAVISLHFTDFNQFIYFFIFTFFNCITFFLFIYFFFSHVKCINSFGSIFVQLFGYMIKVLIKADFWATVVLAALEGPSYSLFSPH